MSRHHLMLAATTALASTLAAPATADDANCDAVAEALTSARTEVQSALMTEIDPPASRGRPLPPIWMHLPGQRDDLAG